MRILHTSDWHLGRNLELFSRQAEQEKFLNELISIAKDEKADLAVIAGDIFDTANPPVWAEKLYYDTLKRLTDEGVGVLVISGNHDSPQGLCSEESLAGANGIIMCEYPSTKVRCGSYGDILTVEENGEGWMKIRLKNGEKAVIATLPYPSESRIAKLVSFVSGEDEIKASYNERIKKITCSLAEHFMPDCANIFVSHLYINGGKPSDSERNFQLGGAYALNADIIPPECDCALLGHLHRPQRVSGAMCPAYYSGSPLAYSFSEAGYAKSVYIVDVINHKAEIKPVELTCGRTLISTQAGSAAEAIAWCEAHGGDDILAELKIVSDMPISTEQLKTMREACPGLVSIIPDISSDAILNENKGSERLMKPIEESFADFYRLKNGCDMPDNVRKIFADLRGEA